MSCASCHNDGGSDGRVWDLTGMGEGLRNTDLAARQGRHGARASCTGARNFDEVQDFEGQIRALAGGTGLMTDAAFNQGTRSQPLGDPKAGLSADLDALAAYVASLNAFAPSPHRKADGTLTRRRRRRPQRSSSAQGCAQCHGGGNFTESGAATLRDVGTIRSRAAASGSAHRSRARSRRRCVAFGRRRRICTTARRRRSEERCSAHNGVTSATPDLSEARSHICKQIDGQEPAPPASSVAWWRRTRLTRALGVRGGCLGQCQHRHADQRAGVEHGQERRSAAVRRGQRPCAGQRCGRAGSVDGRDL